MTCCHLLIKTSSSLIGITTAASVWLAAAVGVGAGGALYGVTAYSTALITIVLRFGPRLYFQTDRGFDEDDNSDDEEGSIELPTNATNMRENASNVELNNMKSYGTTDAEAGFKYETATLLTSHAPTTSQDRSDNTNATQNNGPCKDNKILSWLIKFIPSKVHRQLQNPYQDYTSDKDIKRFIMKKKSNMKKSKSGVSFCT